MAKRILITGGSGFIGKKLSNALLAKGHEVVHLSRHPKSQPAIKTYLWNVEKQEIDPHCLDGVDTIVHLAGAGIADKLWTMERKEVIIKSRTESIALLYQLIKTKPNEVKNIISASAIGYYGHRDNQELKENDISGNDFMAKTCILWENAVDEGKTLGLRIVKLRTGVVLDKENGALPKLALPIKFYVGATLAGGKQWMSWIHVDDVVNMYIFAIENQQVEGEYNMASPNPATNKEITKKIAKQLHKPLWMPNIPELLLQTVLGEMKAVVTSSTKVNVDKMVNAGFVFKFPELEDALKDIYEG